MARPDPASELLTASEERDDARSTADDQPRMRLVVTRGHLAIELDAPWDMAPLQLQEVGVSLPDVAFPVELSGGVAAFKHIRGRLDVLGFEIATSALQRWLKPRLRGLLDPGMPQLVVLPCEDGWEVGLRGTSCALGFRLVVAPAGGDLRLLVCEARGIGLQATAQAMAIRAVAAATKPFGKLVGGSMVVARAPRALMRAFLPLAGMRVPDCRELHFAAPVASLQGLSIRLERASVARPMAPEVVSQVALAAALAEAEGDLLAGRLDAARRGYLAALEAAPRHPEISRRLAELDAVAGDRTEAALAILSDTMAVVDAGALGATLLEQAGDAEGALAAWRTAAEAETFGALAAMAWLRMAQWVPPEAQRGLLDEAVARAPGWAWLRWRRFAHALACHEENLMADVEHLEAHAVGSSERHAVLLRAAEAMLDAGRNADAIRCFERALRYQPSSIDSVTGLARSLRAMGHHRRALELLSRAVGLAMRSGQTRYRLQLELGRALAEVADDLPTAIAHVRQIPAWQHETFEARLLEAQWRAQLGDLAGASVACSALGQAAEAALHALVPSYDPAFQEKSRFVPLWGESTRFATAADTAAAIAAWLEQAARIEEFDRGDRVAAKQLLALAMRLWPKRTSIRQAFRRVAGELQKNAADADVQEPGLPPRTAQARGAPGMAERGALELLGGDEQLAFDASLPNDSFDLSDTWMGGKDGAAGELGDADIEQEMLADHLAERHRANPEDEEVVRALAEVLAGLGRTHALVAVMSARMDEGERSADERHWARRLLTDLAERFEADGRGADAVLLRLLLERD